MNRDYLRRFLGSLAFDGSLKATHRRNAATGSMENFKGSFAHDGRLDGLALGMVDVLQLFGVKRVDCSSFSIYGSQIRFLARLSAEIPACS